MKILDHRQIQQKIKRLAIEIYESNLEEEKVIFAGINNNGLFFAKLLHQEFQQVSGIASELVQIRLNPASPLSDPIELNAENGDMNKAVVIVVDDVANTGRTIFFALKPFLEVLPKKVEVAVLVDRKHKHFPIQADYVGLSLATTLMENILVDLSPNAMAAFLE